MQTYQHYTKVNQSQVYDNHTHEHVGDAAKLSYQLLEFISTLLVEVSHNSKKFLITLPSHFCIKNCFKKLETPTIDI